LFAAVSLLVDLLMSETHEHLEHAEHAAHGADPFTIRVAMTMAIIAAILAAISLIGHRKHNEALQSQGDANRFYTEAATNEVKSSNEFAFYQAKRARVEQAKYAIEQAKLQAPAPNSETARSEAIAKWNDYIKNTENKVSDITVDAAGFPILDKKGEKDNSPGALLVRGKKYEELSKHSHAEAKKREHEYDHVHHQADFLDVAHLAVELGLVLCTICILTKKREFWLAGILASVAGVGIAAYALLYVH
jgi:hypothetical protein